MKGSRLIFRTMVSCYIDGVTQEVMLARIENAVSNGVGRNHRQIRDSYQAEAGQAAELSRRKEQIPRCREKLLRETDCDRTVNRHRWVRRKS